MSGVGRVGREAGPEVGEREGGEGRRSKPLHPHLKQCAQKNLKKAMDTEYSADGIATVKNLM